MAAMPPATIASAASLTDGSEEVRIGESGNRAISRYARNTKSRGKAAIACVAT